MGERGRAIYGWADIFEGELDLREAMAGMARPAAEAMLVGEIDEMAQLGAQSDVQAIAASCRAAISPGQPIANWTSSAMESDIVRAIAVQTAILLEENRASVVTVANALIKHRRLTGEVARKLVQGGKSPKKESRIAKKEP
jgi:biotin-(acetyl-CoA carboxylase) ligase